MMVESASWDDWSASNAPPINEDEKWHVALAPGEVKIVSLEQLDDLFRLSIVDSETKVWQDGMAEWQPLGVIAGIEDPVEDKTVIAPKRTHPKPPSPRSSPPPAPQRSAPPRPPSRAPDPIASFYPQTTAATSFYPEPIVVAPIRTVTPLTSVRPLVVSQAPRVANQGGGFGRFLLSLAAIAGVSITLYRNGVVREVATSVHQEALYARLEASLGGPSFGTLRAVEQNTSAQAAAFSPSSADTNAPTDAQPKAAAALATTTSQVATGTPPPVVSLESLAREKAGASAKPDAQANLVARPAAAPSIAQPKFVTTAVAKSAPAAKSAPVAKAEPVVKTPKAPPVEKAAPAVPEKPASQMSDREKLNAAISKMMSSPPPSGKSAKGKSNEYDPLNPKL
jgi:hypothetical protein